MSRIQLSDRFMDIVHKMSDGNPGAIMVLMKLFEHNVAVDPDSALGPFGTILDLDDKEIYGSDIWVLYKDICYEDIRAVIAVMRACQLGFISRESIKSAIAEYHMHPLDVMALIKAVEERLPRFSKIPIH